LPVSLTYRLPPAVQRKTGRLVEQRLSQRSVGEAAGRHHDAVVSLHRPRGQGVQRRHLALRCDLADRVVERIRDVHVALRVDGDIHRVVEQCLAPRTVQVAQHSASGHGGNFAGRRDFANRVVGGVRDVHVAVTVRGQSRRVPEEAALRGAVAQGAGGKAGFVEYDGHGGAGVDGDISVTDEADAVVARIRREDGGTVAEHEQRGGVAELGLIRRSVQFVKHAGSRHVAGLDQRSAFRPHHGGGGGGCPEEQRRRQSGDRHFSDTV